MKQTRFLFVDGLRGLAALAVCLFHIGREYLEVDFLFYGALGVIVFFVLSGYVISHSLMQKSVTGKFFITFAIKRSVRLDPAYWVAIFIAILVLWVPSVLFDYQVGLPSPGDVVIHLTYLQDLTGIDPINVVFWTLCYEIQFYLVFCGLLYLINAFSGNSANNRFVTWIFSLLLAISLLWPLGYLAQPLPGLFIDMWYLFLLGAFARWASENLVAAVVFLLAAAILLLTFFYDKNAQLLAGAVTAISLLLAMRLNTMHLWLSWKWVQYLGKISYSLYLVHDIVGLYVRDTGLHLSNKYLGFSSLSVNYLWCSIALAASIIAADILYRVVERPSHALSKRVDLAVIKSGFRKTYRYCFKLFRVTN